MAISITRRDIKFFILPLEKAIAYIIFFFAFADFFLIVHKNITLDWPAYLLNLSIVLSALLFGMFYRAIDRDQNIATALIAIALILAFTNLMSIFNYLLLPVQFPPIDHALLTIDQWLGFDWIAFNVWASQIPFFSEITRYAYQSIVFQIIFLIIYLAFTKQYFVLHKILLAICIGAIISIGLWCFFPSSGVNLLLQLPKDVYHTIQPVVPHEYAKEIHNMGQTGITFISPKNTYGLIAFPSYHTVLALLLAYGACYYRRFGALFIALNLIMLPGIIIHGSHNLIDVIAGFIVTFFTLWAVHHYTRYFSSHGQ